MNQLNSRRWWIDLAICSAFIAILIAGRGWYLAWLVQGRYELRSLAIDVAGLLFLVFLLRLFDAGLSALVERAAARRVWLRRGGHVLRWMIVFAAAAPLLMTLAQLHPQRIACARTPADLGLPFEAVDFQSRGKRLSGWLIPAEHEAAPVVLIAHGIGANKQNFLQAAVVVHELGLNAFIFDFPAHGDSEGVITTIGYREAEDVIAAHALMAARFPGRPVYALGYSMGGAAIVRAAVERDLFDRIVLDNTFGSAERVAQKSLLWMFGPLKVPAWQLARLWAFAVSGVDMSAHNPEELIAAAARRPILFIHGTADDVIPSSESQALVERAGNGSALWLVPGANHNQSMFVAPYKERLRKFLLASGPKSRGQQDR